MVTLRRGDEVHLGALAGHDFHRGIGNREEEERAQEVEI